MVDSSINTVENRRALEALRNGVPNRDAVRVLGCEQVQVTSQFEKQLGELDSAFEANRQVPGILVEGGFGSGKSHLLEYLKFLANEQNFVCSLIVLGKETPLYDPAKVFAAASDTAVAPGVTGNAIQEIALSPKIRSSDDDGLARWVNREDNGVSPLFAATHMLHERLHNDPEMDEKIRGFWAGEKLPIADVRQGMKQIGQRTAYPLRTVPAKELPFQRFRFASRLIRSAGYSGWVLLFDEAELIGRYSRLQRARSYAELARWLGIVESDQYPGITSVATITDDFTTFVLEGKSDSDYIVPLLEGKDTDAYREMASRAEAGMRLIKRHSLPLKPPSDQVLQATYSTLSQIYTNAYGWNPPDVAVARTSGTRRMRSYVRRWINEWDLARLYPGQTIETVETELKVDYSEAPELEHVSQGETDFAISES